MNQRNEYHVKWTERERKRERKEREREREGEREGGREGGREREREREREKGLSEKVKLKVIETRTQNDLKSDLPLIALCDRQMSFFLLLSENVLKSGQNIALLFAN